jgi:hypothetical protein
MQLFAKHHCDRIIHLGDVETFEVIDELAGHAVTLVFGNCDYTSRLIDYALNLEIDVQHPAGTITIDGITIAFLHGHDISQYQQYLEDDNISVIAHGHSHEIRDEMVLNTRCINPGALHRAPRYTVGILDTDINSFEIFKVEA